ncbi:MAG: hypothetical protein R3F40_03270 [Candidatus Competibacteraceae bacterium]
MAIAEVIEVERKPSIPVGPRGQDAFGGCETFVDRGLRQRAICNLDVRCAITGLNPWSRVSKCWVAAIILFSMSTK